MGARDRDRYEDAMLKKWRKEPLARQCEWPLPAGKGKKTDSPLASPEGIQSYQYFVISPCDPFQISDFHTCKKTNLCCSKPVSMW